MISIRDSNRYSCYSGQSFMLSYGGSDFHETYDLHSFNTYVMIVNNRWRHLDSDLESFCLHCLFNTTKLS